MIRVLALGDCEPVLGRLADGGYEILRAPGRTHALGLARELMPDVILVWAGREVESALELVGFLAGDPATRQLPVLVVLASPESDLARRALEAGALNVLVADGPVEENRARLDAAARQHQVLDELLRERQRATLVELAGAVAHKINQPLTSMSILVETLHAAQTRGELSEDRLLSKLEELQRLVDRMALIVKQVGGVAEYRTIDYVGQVKIIDLDSAPKRKPG